MARSNSVLVTVSKILTTLSLYVSPTSGNAPLVVTVDGMLLDSGGAGIGGKTINIIMNGEVIGTDITTTEVAPEGPGYYKTYYEITAPGDYTFETEFLGDATYEGCVESNHVTVEGEIVEPPPIPLWKIGAVALAILGGGAGAYAVTRKE